MKTNYTKIDQALTRLLDAQSEVRRVASLRIGIISGGPSIDEENAEAEQAYNELISLVIEALNNGAKEKRMMSAIINAPIRVLGLVRNHYDEIRYNREYSALQRRGLV